MEKFSTVEDFLIAQMSQRPVTFREIELSVEKPKPSIIRELRQLVRMGRIKIVEVRFNARVVPFYTIRQRIDAEILEFAQPRYLNKISAWKHQGADHGDSRRRSGGEGATQRDDRGDSSGDGGSASSRHRVFKRCPRREEPYLVAPAEEAEF